MFVTVCTIPKNGQLNMIYDEGEETTDAFFEERGLCRCDVWTKTYPTKLKAGVKAPSQLKLKPPKDWKPHAKTETDGWTSSEGGKRLVESAKMMAKRASKGKNEPISRFVEDIIVEHLKKGKGGI